MEKTGLFEDFDDEDVYKSSRERAILEGTRNFVVGFGRKKAAIAFDIEAGDLRTVLEAGYEEDAPVKWMSVSLPLPSLFLQYGEADFGAVTSGVPTSNAT